MRLVAMILAMAAVGTVALASCKSAPREDGARLERLTLTPTAARRSVGQVQHFTATGHYADGTTRNLTQRVTYASSDPAIARAANAKGNCSRIEALAAGTVTISATDPKTGIGSHASSGDATFTVLGALERVTLSPVASRRWVGQSQRLTATGHYAGGATRNLTQHVVYRSSDPTIAAAPNAAGDKSRVDALGGGPATMPAGDPARGIDTSAGGGDATVTVTAPAGG
jgi:uncharacterized protein YjdB